MGRGGISFEGIGAQYTTYKLKATDNFTQDDEGKAVTITGSQEVGYGNEGNPLLGVVLRVEADGYGSIQDAGYAEVEYASGQSAPALGSAVVVTGDGLVSQAASTYSGRMNIVVSQDTTNRKVFVLLG
jgi:hypothetical protein